MPIYKKINKDFFKKWTHEMAYVLGFFAADGNMVTNNRGAQFWSIEVKDKKLLESVRETVQSDHKISIRYKGDKNTHSEMYRLQIGSFEMCNDLYRLGMKENKTYSLSIPNVPNPYLPHFVRGYFDGDGHVWMGNINRERMKSHLVIQTVFTSCSKIFLEKLSDLLKNEGMVGGNISAGKGDYYRLTYSINDSLKLYNFMYNGSYKLFLNRKKLVFERFINQRKLRA